MLYSDSLSRSLKASIHKRISENEISCMELTVRMRIDWRSQQSVQVRGVDQLPLLLESVML